MKISFNFIGGCVLVIILRMYVKMVLGFLIDKMYLTANSHSMYKKLKPELKKRNRFLWSTRLCFWNARSEMKGNMRFLIVLNTIAYFLIVTVVALFPTLRGETAMTRIGYAIWCFFYFFTIVCILPVNMWGSHILHKRENRKRSPRK